MTQPTYKVDIRWPDAQRLSDRTQTADAETALAAYRRLLSRTDLIGKNCAARFVVDGRSLFYSEFNRPVGEGRVHPDAPLRADTDAAGASVIAQWTPPVASPVKAAVAALQADQEERAALWATERASEQEAAREAVTGAVVAVLNRKGLVVRTEGGARCTPQRFARLVLDDFDQRLKG
jgi:hypothetical protein